MENPIPNFYAKVTNPKIVNEILRKNPAANEALSCFNEFKARDTRKTITVGQMSEKLISFDGNQLLRRKWNIPRLVINIVCQAFVIGNTENARNAIVLDQTKKIKMTDTNRKPDFIRDLLCYDGTSYSCGKKVSSILVVLGIDWKSGESVVRREVITTLYKLPKKSRAWLRNVLKSQDDYFGHVLRLAGNDAMDAVVFVRKMARSKTDRDLALEAEELRRRNKSER